jgi:hypothetical protein
MLIIQVPSKYEFCGLLTTEILLSKVANFNLYSANLAIDKDKTLFSQLIKSVELKASKL